MDREEAIEIVKKNYPHVSSSGTQFESALRELIPELKENEDEMIRKSLVEYFRKFTPENMWDEMFSFGDVVSYIERQKEQKPVKLNDDTEVGLDRALQIVRAARGNLSGYQSDDGIYECCHAIQTLERILENGIEQQPVECIEDSVKFKEGFKAGRESGLCDGQKYVLDNFDSYGLCKPAEWSKEDEALIENVCTALKGYALHERKVDLDEHAHRLEEMSEKLKSLCHKLYWKPSEEQMNALGFVHDFHTFANPKNKAAIGSLYNDLKEL